MLLRATFGDALLRSHRELLRGLDSLRAVASPDTTPADLATCLDRLRTSLEGHFRFEENNGYLASILQRRPYLEGSVDYLTGEHGELLLALDSLRLQARATQAVTPELRAAITRWLGQVRRHERREDALVQDAFNVDLTDE